MKRIFRDCPEEVKEKLRNNPTLHQKRKPETRAKIAQGMQKYWKTIPNKPKSGIDKIRNGEIV